MPVFIARPVFFLFIYFSQSEFVVKKRGKILWFMSLWGIHESVIMQISREHAHWDMAGGRGVRTLTHWLSSFGARVLNKFILTD